MPKHTSKRRHAKRSRSRRSNKKTRRNGRKMKVGGVQELDTLISGKKYYSLDFGDFNNSFTAVRVKVISLLTGKKYLKNVYKLTYLKNFKEKENEYTYFIFDAINETSLTILKRLNKTEITQGIREIMSLPKARAYEWKNENFEERIMEGNRFTVEVNPERLCIVVKIDAKDVSDISKCAYFLMKGNKEFVEVVTPIQAPDNKYSKLL